jgi:hypothetical protein
MRPPRGEILIVRRARQGCFEDVAALRREFASGPAQQRVQAGVRGRAERRRLLRCHGFLQEGILPRSEGFQARGDTHPAPLDRGFEGPPIPGHHARGGQRTEQGGADDAAALLRELGEIARDIPARGFASGFDELL